MTPTPEQLAAVLPRCSAGLDGMDWTENDDRLEWSTKVMHYVEVAAASTPEPPKRSGVNALSCAIIEALGVDPNKVTGVRYEHSIPDLPTASLDVIALSDDLTHFDTIEQKWVLADELQHCDSGLDAVLPAGNPESGPEGTPKRDTDIQRRNEGTRPPGGQVKRTGVIVRTTTDIEPWRADSIVRELTDRFPGVRFAVVPGAQSVAFEYDDPSTTPPPPEGPPPPNRGEVISWGRPRKKTAEEAK